MCLVVGDVNSTLACALVAAKELVPVAHVEAGLRSFDRSMPEEINRVVTDSLSDYLFVTEPSGVENLRREGRSEADIHLVGNVMIDTLLRMKPKAESLRCCETYGLKAGRYVYLTLHRPSNVDDAATLREIVDQVIRLSERIPIAFMIHPRTQISLEKTGLYRALQDRPGIKMSRPIGYLESLSMVIDARVVLTDSGGLQEETSALGVPCLTLRENTERPITVEKGTNTIIAGDWELFQDCARKIESGEYPGVTGGIPNWDGRAGERVLRILAGNRVGRSSGRATGQTTVLH